MSFLGIDVGTTGCKVVALSADGQLLGIARREYDVIRAQPGYAELDSRHVWNCIKDSIRELVILTADDPVVALCVSSMGEAMTPVSRDRQILGNCLLGFDTRGSETLRLLSSLDPTEFFERSGNVPTGNTYGGQKLLWLRDHRPRLFESTYKFLNWADLVIFLLGGEPVTDYSLANRSLFLDIRRQVWSAETLDMVGMPSEKLPQLAQAGSVVGALSTSAAGELGLSTQTRLVIGAHDQCASALGAGVIRSGLAAYGLGTYFCITPAFADFPDSNAMIRAKLNIEHHAVGGLYVSFLYNLTGGALLKWFRNTLARIDYAEAQARGEDVYGLLLSEMPDEPTDLLVLPHFAPTGPPYFDEHPFSLIGGLSLETDRGTLIKGLLEGVTYYFRNGIDVLEEAGIVTDEYRVTGGGARSDAWLQIQADILGKPLIRPVMTEAGALGAVMLAGVGAGVYTSVEQAVGVLVRHERVFEPDSLRHQIYEQQFERYCLLYPFSQKLSAAKRV